MRWFSEGSAAYCSQRRLTRWMAVLPVCVAMGVGARPSSALAATPAPTDNRLHGEESRGIQVSVEVPDSDDAAYIKGGIVAEASRLLEVNGIELGEAGSLQIDVRGDYAKFKASVNVRINGEYSKTGSTVVDCDPCSKEMLITAVLKAVAKATPVLKGEVAQQTPKKPEHEGAGENRGASDKGASKRPARLKWTGVGLLGLGVAGTVAGVVLIALAPKVRTEVQRDETRTRLPGYAVLGGGLAVAAVGGVLLGLGLRAAKKNKQQHTRVVPMLRVGSFGLLVETRF